MATASSRVAMQQEIDDLMVEAERMLAEADKTDTVILATMLGENKRFRKRNRSLISSLGVVAALLVGVILIQLLVNYPLLNDSQNILDDTISQKDRVIEQREDRIDELQEQVKVATRVLNEQAVPAIVAMAQQIKELGAEPPLVELNPDKLPPEEG